MYEKSTCFEMIPDRVWKACFALLTTEVDQINLGWIAYSIAVNLQPQYTAFMNFVKGKMEIINYVPKSLYRQLVKKFTKNEISP